MAYNDDQQFDLTKPLDPIKRTTMARNLEMIENERRWMNGDRERREQEELIKKQEESQRRLLREREESERRLAQDQERRERERLEREEEHAQEMLEVERERAEIRALEEEKSYQRKLDYQQEKKRREMAVSYTEYDRNNEYYYYYDERGDYLDTMQARLRWQQLHAPSYLEYDPKDDFWQYFLDGFGKVIPRKEAFVLWQPDHCPDYRSYSEGAVWTTYRCGDGFISADDARERWLKECADSDGVKEYLIDEKVKQIISAADNGVIAPPKLEESKTKALAREADKQLEASNNYASKMTKFYAIVGLLFILLSSISFLLYIWKSNSSFLARKDTLIKLVIASVVSFIVFYINSKADENKKEALRKQYSEKRSKLWRMDSAYNMIKNSFNSGRAFDDDDLSEILDDELYKGFDDDEDDKEYESFKKEIASFGKRTYCEQKRFLDDTTKKLPLDYIEDIALDYYEVTAVFSRELLLKPYNKKLLTLFQTFENKKVKLNDKKITEHTLTLTWLSYASARELSDMLTEAGAVTKIGKREKELFRKTEL